MNVCSSVTFSKASCSVSMSKLNYLVFILLFTFLAAQSQPLIFLDKEELNYFGDFTSIIKDSDKNRTIDEIIKMDSKFVKQESRVFNTSQSGSVFWIKFRAKNLTDNSYYLVIDNPLLYQLNVFSVDDKEVAQLFNSGIFNEFSKRVVHVNNFVIPIPLQKGESKDFYIRYYSNWRMELPLSFKSSNIVVEDTLKKGIWYGVFYGILMISFIYNFAIYRFFKHKSYLYFLLFILSSGFVRALNQGFISFLFSPDPKFEYLFLSLPILLVGFSLIGFSVHFLDIEKSYPKYHQILNAVNILFVGVSFFILFDRELWYKCVTFFMLIVSPFLIYLSIISHLKGPKGTIFYVLGALTYQIVIFIIGLRNASVLPFSFALYNLADIGFILIIFFFTMAMGDNYSILEEEKREAQKNLNEELKLKIDERKKNQEVLRKLNLSLKNTNLDLDNFIYTASHELKSPVSNIEALTNILKKETLSRIEFNNILSKMDISIQKFRDAINNLTEVSQVQKMRNEKVEDIFVGQLMEEVKESLKDIIYRTSATIIADVQDCPVVRYSRKNLFLILYNLVHNAIKFKHPYRIPVIIIKSEESNMYYILSVSDNGLGVNEINKSKIFSLFKSAHSKSDGKGIGLYIIKRIIESEDGTINLESKVGEGTTFTVHIKK